MEPTSEIAPDKDFLIVQQQPNINITPPNQQTNLEKLSRPMAFEKMENLVREMKDENNGVPVRHQKIFLTSIPYAFMGYDLIEWLMDRLTIEESEALNLANQLCLHGYFFPVNDTKTLVVKDDSSLYRFQSPYYWPWQHKAPDNIEYAIYLTKRSLRNKQRHGLEDYETEALASLHKNLKGKWDVISMQAEEHVRLAKERKKGDKIVSDSQERAYWRVHRPPPGQFTPLEPCPVPSRDRTGTKHKKKNVEDWQREVDYLTKSFTRTRMKMSQACESLVNYWEIFSEYDFFLQPVLPSNPWVSEDMTFWQLNNAIVDIPTEKRVKRWGISIEELVSDPTGLQEFTTFLEKEYSHENIRFWIEVNKLRRSAHSQVAKKVNEIYEEFLKPGAPCEINIDGKTMDVVQKGLKSPSRFTFDAAAEHIYMLLLKKDCYPRFMRSDHYKSLLASGIQPSHKKRFFNFGGAAKKKTATMQQPNQNLTQPLVQSGGAAPGNLRRRGSDRSLSGSAHELTIIGIKDGASKVPHSHSQSNLSEIPYREPTKQLTERLESTLESHSVCPWDTEETVEPPVQLAICPWEDDDDKSTEPVIELKVPVKTESSISSDIAEVSEKMKRSCGLRQNTVDADCGVKKLTLIHNEQRRSSMTTLPRLSEFQINVPLQSLRTVQSVAPSPCDAEEQLFQSSNNLCEGKEAKNQDASCSENSNTQIQIKEDVSTRKNSIVKCNENNRSTSSEVLMLDIAGSSTNIKDITDHPVEVNNPKTQDNVTESIEDFNSGLKNRDTETSDPINLPQEEMSPTTEEYQEGVQFEEHVGACDCRGIEEDDPHSMPIGCVAPAPTPAPLLAPLAEIEIDSVEDDVEIKLETKPEAEETKRKRRKRSSDAKKIEEKIENKAEGEEADNNRNAVCPWEDEDLTTSDGTFTKTYATLGYL
ncbi:uncharacterized protein LOC129614265 [Condylostylus longicornis]|uniref:uncharacterized protein LOC129614265 n=1 Tax=Condylostylus longicornis TaxID=2530218 RepID=UPI00244DC6FC|nr:uncharacterized protein LOC129614265 [Condylostylus longicornis]